MNKKKFYASLVIFSLLGQIAWVVENMYFNVYISKEFGANQFHLALMVSLSAIVATLTTLFVGAYSDKINKRKIFIWLGYIIWGLTILAFCLFSKDNISIFIPSTIDACAVGISITIILDCLMTFFGSIANDASFNAWITDNTEPKERGKVEGITSMMPLLAILVVFGLLSGYADTGKWWILFLIIGTLTLVAGIIGIFTIQEKKKEEPEKIHYFKRIFYGFKPSSVKKNLVLYVSYLGFALFGIAIQIFMTFLIQYYEIYIPGTAIGMPAYVLVMGPAIILAAAFTFFYGRLYDKYKFFKSVLPALGILILGLGLLSLTYLNQHIVLVFIGSLLMMCGNLATSAIFNAKMRDLTPKDKVGSYQGIKMFAQVLIPMLIGPWIGAAAISGDFSYDVGNVLVPDGYTYTVNPSIFVGSLVICLLTLIPIFIINHLENKKNKRNHLDSDDSPIQEKPLSEYPRPQFKRDSYISLNGEWEIEFSNEDKIPETFNEKIIVPYPIESKLSGLNNRYLQSNEIAYYKKEFSLPEDFKDEIITLHFDGVDQISEVYLNGHLLGRNKGGYIPFKIDIQDYLKEQNVLIVKVIDNLDKKYCYGKQTKNSKGMWYTKTSGIWKSVWLESYKEKHFEKIKIQTTLNSVTINVSTNIKHKTLIIHTPEGDIKRDFTSNTITVNIPNPINWEPSNPHLYEFELVSKYETIKSYFALRTLTIKKHGKYQRILLNNKPIFFHGLLDQGYFSDGILTPKTYQKYEEEIIALKELGFNTLRKHIKIEPLYFYYLCDKHGMIVFQDMVNNGSYSFFKETLIPTLGIQKLPHYGRRVKKEIKDIFLKQAEDTIELLYNSPSVCYYTIFNEAWGQFDADQVYAKLKALDPSRIYDATSGWFNEKESDVESKHIYFKPIKIKEHDRPIIISEFGGYVYKDLEHSFNIYKTYGYRIYKKQEDFFKGFMKLYEEEIIPYIPYGLCGSIYTQVSDVEDETNGLFTYDRKVLKVEKEPLIELSKKLTIK